MDAAVEELAALKNTSDTAAQGVGERRNRLQTAELEKSRTLEELHRLEIDLRKLRSRDEVRVVYHCLRMCTIAVRAKALTARRRKI